MSTQLATIADFYAFRGEVMPEDMSDADVLELDALLMRASDRVRRILRTARLTWGSDGLPKNGTVRQTIARATAAQASFFRGTGNVDGSGGASGYDNVSMDGVSYSKSARAVGTASNSRDNRIAPEVGEILGSLPIWSTKSR